MFSKEVLTAGQRLTEDQAQRLHSLIVQRLVRQLLRVPPSMMVAAQKEATAQEPTNRKEAMPPR